MSSPIVDGMGSSNPLDVAEGLGLSRSGADFLITKLNREHRLKGKERDGERS